MKPKASLRQVSSTQYLLCEEDIQPLQEAGAILNAMLCAGWLDEGSHECHAVRAALHLIEQGIESTSKAIVGLDARLELRATEVAS